MITTVYLANNILHVLVGNKGKKIKVKRAYTRQIPEGCLINGIITNENDLAEQLKNFWELNRLPKKKVELVINSSQFVQKSLPVPKGKEKRILDLLSLEFADVTGMNDGILDYMEEPGDGGKMVPVHGVMVERSFIQGYLKLFASMGVKVSSVKVGRICALKALMSMKQLRDRTSIVLLLDGSTINSSLWDKGTSVYASQKRVFSEPGTPQFVDEIARVISNILQFASTQGLQAQVKEVFFAGISLEDYELYRKGIQNLNMGVTVGSLKSEKHFRFGKGVTGFYAQFLPELGSMLKVKKDINLGEQAKKKAKGRKKQKVWKRYVALPMALLLIGLGVFGGLYGMETKKQRQLEEIQSFVNDSANKEICLEADILQAANGILSRRIHIIESMNNILLSYPDMNSSVVAQLQGYALGKAVALEVQSYSAEDGTLSVDAMAAQVTLINQFIDELENSGIFDDIQYTGYTYDEDKLLYTINVTFYLSENAGK